MKKALAVLICMACFICAFAGCRNVGTEPKNKTTNIKTEKTLTWQEVVSRVFNVEMCEFNSDKSAVTTQIRND